MRASGTVYCRKAASSWRQRWIVATWTLKVRATSVTDFPSSMRFRASALVRAQFGRAAVGDAACLGGASSFCWRLRSTADKWRTAESACGDQRRRWRFRTVGRCLTRGRVVVRRLRCGSGRARTFTMWMDAQFASAARSAQTFHCRRIDVHLSVRAADRSAGVPAHPRADAAAQRNVYVPASGCACARMRRNAAARAR